MASTRISGIGLAGTPKKSCVPEAWIPVLFIASATSRTQPMREALPATISHHDAAAAVSRAALLATAVITSDAGLLRTGTRGDLALIDSALTLDAVSG